MCIHPHFLSFFFAQVFALVNLIMAFQAQCSHLVVISLDASAFATAPVCVCSLNHVTRPAGLAVKTCHHLQQFFASYVFVFCSQLLSPLWKTCAYWRIPACVCVYFLLIFWPLWLLSMSHIWGISLVRPVLHPVCGFAGAPNLNVQSCRLNFPTQSFFFFDCRSQTFK